MVYLRCPCPTNPLILLDNASKTAKVVLGTRTYTTGYGGRRDGAWRTTLPGTRSVHRSGPDAESVDAGAVTALQNQERDVLKTRQLRNVALAGLLAVSLVLPALAQDVHVNPDAVKPPKPEYSPYLEHNYPDRVFLGDTHLHTSYSTDAGMLGNRLGPDEAYRFARGEEVTSSTGVRARLARPLDFLVVADHAENLGLAPMIAESNPDLLKTEFGRKVHDLVKGGKRGTPTTTWGAACLGQRPAQGARRADAHDVGSASPRRPRRTTSRAGSRPSSASSGPPPRAATTCIATSSSVTARTRPIRSFRSPTTTASIPKTCGNGWPRYEQKTGGRLPGHPAQRQPLQWPDVRRRDPDHERSRSTATMRSAACAGSRSTKSRR